MINLYQLQSFVTVIAEGSMTAAADKLFLTQPAISQQIRNLEEEIGKDFEFIFSMKKGEIAEPKKVEGKFQIVQIDSCHNNRAINYNNFYSF